MTTIINNRAGWTNYILGFNNVASVTYNRDLRAWILEASNWAADGIALEGFFTIERFGNGVFAARRTTKAHQG